MSNLQSIVIDPEFSALIPPLQDDEYQQLKASILSEGCRDALVVWQGHNVLIDGHNRYRICTDNGIEFKTVEREFADRDAVADWMIDNQLARRNLTREQMSYLRGEKYNRVKKKQGRPEKGQEKSGKSFHINTRDEIADETGVTGRTISNDGKYAENLNTLAETIAPEVREGVLSGAIKATVKDIHDLAEIAKTDPKEAKAVVDTLSAGKLDNLRDAQQTRKFLKDKDKQFTDFVERHAIRELWRVELFHDWYTNNHNDFSKFGEIEHTGILHFQQNDDVNVLTASLRLLRDAEKRWAKHRRLMEMQANRADRVDKIIELSSVTPDIQDIEIRYPVIYADPPWQYEFSQSSNREIENHYPTMPLQEICELPISQLAADDAVLFMWATNPKLIEAIEVIKAWGFTYKTCAVWVKDKIGMGYYFRSRHELLLVATRGNIPTPEPHARADSVLEYPRLEHSAKPHTYYEIIDKMYPEYRKIELFSRNYRKGWDGWGNQYEQSA